MLTAGAWSCQTAAQSLMFSVAALVCLQVAGLVTALGLVTLVFHSFLPEATSKVVCILGARWSSASADLKVMTSCEHLRSVNGCQVALLAVE